MLGIFEFFRDVITDVGDILGTPLASLTVGKILLLFIYAIVAQFF